MSSNTFVGPLGLWKFPIINMIRQRLLGLTNTQQTRSVPRETLRNAEKWGIVRDDKGRMIALEIHRSVEET
jgi:hypothetical protein